MYRILLVLLLLVSSFVIAQQTPGEKTIESYNFGTLETKSGPFNAKAGGATTYHNLDPSRRLGSLNKRWGYSEIDELNDGFDSLTGIYSAYLSDGRQFLVYAADSAGVGYGGLYITESGSDSISNASRFWKYWSPTAPTTFSMFDDKLYAMNGVQAGAVYNFDTRKAIRFPIPAPSEPIVVPIDAGDNLDGEYRYAIYVYYNGAGNIKDLGVITAPVRVSTGSVLLTGFQRPNLDSLVTGSDSIHINVYRTLANPGRLEQTDTLWRVFTSYIDTAAIDTFTIIDTLADASINHATFNKSPWPLYTQVTGLDSAGTWSYNKYGAPGYYRRGDSLYTLAKDTTRPGGIYNGIPRMNDTLGVFYAATFLDTLNSIESDTGRSLYVSNDSINGSAGRHWWIRLTMPKLPDSTENTVINLYRAHRIVVGRDTSFTVPSQSNPDKWVDEQNKKAGFDLYYIASENCRTANGVTICDKVIKMRSLTADTVVTSPYYLVAQVGADSAYFTDSTRYDSLVLQPLFRKTPPSTRLTQPFAYNGRMFGIDGSNLAWSLVDSASRWGAFDFISVNKDDGQRITLAYPTRRSIRVLKDASSYNVYQDGGGNWNLTEVTNGIGCIAPNSHAVSPAGHYYLSQDGVILETEGDYLERTYKTGLISANLDNFDKLPMSAKSKAVGTYWNHKYFLTVPIAGANDTTYVWDELAQGWATWSMPVGGAAIYDTESVAGYAPGNSMYFYYPNGKTLYQYGNSLTDAGAYIWSNWTSTPFLTDEYEEAVSAIGVWFDDISAGDFIRFYDIVDGRDTVRSNLALFTDLGDTVGYREEAVASLRTGAYHQLAMWSTPDASGTWSRIDKINVSYLPLGKRTRFGETTAFVGGESGEGGAGTITFGDITGVIAGYGLSGGGLSGDVTLNSDTSVIATKQFVRDSAAAGVAPDSVLYADSSGYADTAGVALNGGSTDSFYVAEATSTTAGWKQSGDTIFVDTSGGSGSVDSFYVAKGDTTVIGWKQSGDTIFVDTTGGSGTSDSFYVAKGDTTVIGWKQTGDTIFIDTTGGVGGGMSMDSTTAGNGLIESANDLAVRPGYGIDTVGDLVRVDSTEFASVFRLRDTAAAVRVDIRDTVTAMGIAGGMSFDSTGAGNGLVEITNNVLEVRPGFGIDTTNDLVLVDFTDLDDTLPRYARIRDTAALMIEDSLDNYILASKVRDTVGVIDTFTIDKIYSDTIIIGTDTLFDDRIMAYYVRLEVRNAGTGATLPKGTPVYLTGSATADIPHVDSAKSASSATMPAVGLLEADIANNAVGYCVVSGEISTINTSAYNVGDALYVGSDGGLTTTKPTSTNLIQKVGLVTRDNISVGQIHVTGANRTNDIPNIASGSAWIGNATAVATATDVKSYIDTVGGTGSIRADIRDTVNIMGITDSTAAGNGLTESGNTINAVGKIYILAGADSLALDTASLRTWAATVVVDSAKKVDTTYAPLVSMVNKRRDSALADIRDTLNIMGYRTSTNRDTIFIFNDNDDTCKYYSDGTNMVQDCGEGAVIVDSLKSLGPIYLIVGADTSVITKAFVDSVRGGDFIADSTSGGAARAELADSTTGGAARAEIADSAKAVDTAYAPLVALVNRHIRDTAAVMIEDSLDNYTLLTDFAKVTDDTTAVLAAKDSVADWDNGALDSTNLALGSVLSSEIKDGEVKAADIGALAVTLAKIDTTGVTNNYVLKKTSSGATWAAQDALTDFTDIYGTLRVHGQIPTYNDGNDPDIYSLAMFHGDTNIYKGHMLPYHMRNVDDTNAAGLRTDSLDFVHPSGFYDPNMTFGWKMIVSFTGYDEPDVIEDPFIRVSNDGVSWYKFKKLDSLVVDSCVVDTEYVMPGPDTVLIYQPCYDSFFTTASDTIIQIGDLPDSIAFWEGTKYAVKYLSDNELIHGHDGNVHLYIRASAVDGGDVLKSSAIYHIQSSDMITWSDTSRSIDWYDGTGRPWDLLSPSVFLGSNQSYNMLTIHTSETSTDSISYIMRYRSNHPDTGWVLVDTVRDSLGVSIKFGKNSESRLENDAYAWHMDVIDWGADAKIALIVAKYKIAAGQGFDMYVGKTRDDGVTMEIRKDPILRCVTSDPLYAPSAVAWDKAYIYKATGWRINKGNRTVLQIPYSAMQGTTNPSQGFHSGMGEAEFMNWSKLDFNEVAGRRNAPADSMLLTFPNWADSTGVMDRWVDSSTAIVNGSGRHDIIFMRATVSDPFLLDTLILSNFITTDSGTGIAVASDVSIDSIAIMGPDFSSGTNAADSLWWSSGTARTANTRTTTKIALNIYQLAPAGSVFKIVIVNKLDAANSAVHMERVAIKGRER